jgi:hypothetical protein
MAFQQVDIINSEYFFYSQLRNERVYLFGPLVLSSWYYENHVLVNYTDGRSEQILTPFTTQMEVDYGEETKMNEEEEIPQARRDVVGGAVAGGESAIDVDTDDEEEEVEFPQAQQPNMVTDDEDDDTDIEEPDDEENIIVPDPVDMN